MDDKHTGDNINETVKSVLEEFGALQPTNIYVTDNASNMKAAFRDNICQ